MIITLGPACAISEKGGRRNNEDSIFPIPESSDVSQKLFLVCDGVGGADKGEVASALACESFNTYFNTFLEGDPSESFIKKAIQYVEVRFDDYVINHPEAHGMATTFTMVFIGRNGVIAAHSGDSRIYQFRNGKIIYRSEDHSLVNLLVKSGKITPEEAIHHPQRNIITQAIQGTHRPTESDVELITDVEPGDYFFMCTDGTLEKLRDSALESIFSSNSSAVGIKDEMQYACNGKTKDNYSFYIIPIQNVQESAGIKQNILSFFYSLV